MLSPTAPGEFWERYWGREHLHLHRDDGGTRDCRLKVDDLDTLLESELFPAAFFNVVTNGVLHPVDEWSRMRDSARGSERVVLPERLFELYLGGATLILNQAHLAIPRLSEFCRELSAELGLKVQANIYVTPPGARGFSAHTDDHEVFAIQIRGAKSWRILPSGDPIEVGMRAGDLLYIPRGLAHEALAQDTASIHVTLGLHALYPFELLEELAAKARGDARFQRPLTPGVPPDDGEFRRLAGDLLAESTAVELGDHRFETFVKDQSRGWAGRLTDTIALADLTLLTVVRARPGIAHRITTNGKSIDVEFAGHKLTAPVFLAGCVDKIVSGEPFAIGDLQGLIADAGRIEMVKRFVQAGFLTIVRQG